VARPARHWFRGRADPGRSQRPDREHEDRSGAGGDRLLARLPQAVIEAATALAEGSRPEAQRQVTDLIIGRHDERLVDARRPDGSLDRRSGEPQREVTPFFGVEYGAET
jgi:hypothetical protein